MVDEDMLEVAKEDMVEEDLVEESMVDKEKKCMYCGGGEC